MTDEQTIVTMLRRAYMIGWNLSDDRESKNGAVLVDRFGSIVGESANVFPRGVRVSVGRLGRPTKYGYMVHAETGAIYEAARKGHATDGGCLYVPWAACQECAKGIIQAGISCVVLHLQCLERTHGPWQHSIEKAQEMLDESGVLTVRYDGKIGACEARLDSKDWLP